ncbi:hypothetical protein Pelo_5476 [Pelomyxa schiedti]|nr:hypothetical protein Pelo_5476 [Pelomyxa schiedti]
MSRTTHEAIELLLAAVLGNAEVTRDILARNPTIDINARYQGSTTLLHEAGSAAVARLLLTSPHRPYSDVNRERGRGEGTVGCG